MVAFWLDWVKGSDGKRDARGQLDGNVTERGQQVRGKEAGERNSGLLWG